MRLLHGTALVWSKPEEAAWELASAVDLGKSNPWIVARGAPMLLHVGKLPAARSYVEHARQLAGEDAVLAAELAIVERDVRAVEREHTEAQ